MENACCILTEDQTILCGGTLRFLQELRKGLFRQREEKCVKIKENPEESVYFRERGSCMKREIALKPPCKEYDVQGIESWLQYQSLTGDHLFDTAGRTFYFREGEPKKLVFRLEPHGKKRIDEKQKEEWRRRGWTYAASYRHLYDIFFSETEEREETEALAASQSVGLQFLDQRFGSLRFGGIFLIALTAVLCWMNWKKSGTILQFFYGSGLFAVLLLAAYLMFWISALVMGVWLRRQTGSLKAGKPMPDEEYQSSMRKEGRFLKVLEGFWTASVLLILVMNLSSSSGSLGETAGCSDFLSLARMEGEHYTPDLEQGKPRGQSYRIERNPLVKKNLYVKQSGYKFQDQAAEAGIPVKLQLYLYETRREENAQKLLDQVCSKYMGISQRANLYQKGIYGFDDVSVIDMEENRQIVCARGGSTAAILFYEGDLDMNDHLQYISRSVMAGKGSWKEELKK